MRDLNNPFLKRHCHRRELSQKDSLPSGICPSETIPNQLNLDRAKIEPFSQKKSAYFHQIHSVVPSRFVTHMRVLRPQVSVRAKAAEKSTVACLKIL